MVVRIMAEETGFEPAWGCPLTVFKTVGAQGTHRKLTEHDGRTEKLKTAPQSWILEAKPL
jgi:hypothetical protein